MGALLLEGIPFLPPSFRLLGKQSQMGVCKGCAFALVTPLGSLVYGCLVMCIFGYQSSLCKITPLYPLVVPTLVAYRIGHTLLVPCGLRDSSVTLLHFFEYSSYNLLLPANSLTSYISTLYTLLHLSQYPSLYPSTVIP
jgi:hypothetical protein